MKVLKKIEDIVITFAMAFILWFSSAIGGWELVYEYEFLDMGSNEAMVLYLPFLIALTYWIIKKTVFRVIRIVKG